MASELNLTAGAYAKIERGETDPSISRLAQIAAILNVDVTFFLREPAHNFILEEPVTRYVANEYASKHDVENLTQLIRQIQQKLEKLEQCIHPKKKHSKEKKQ